MPPPSPLSPVEEALVSQVWRADALASEGMPTLSTGLPALDAALPGAGWPFGALIEVLQAHAQCPVWQLLAPALAHCLQQQDGPVVLVGAPHPVFTPGLAARGLPPERLLRVQADPPAARAWAAEQALRCAEVAAVLAWFPRVLPADLRRLQAAAQRHRRLLFVLRPEAARSQASPARLRLWLPSGDAPRVHVLKRRGPPLSEPVALPLQPPALAELLRARAPRPLPPSRSPVAPAGRPHHAFLDPLHGLDRAPTLA